MIALDKATVSVGSVTFTIKNDGPSPYNLAFPDLKKVSETIDAGATTKPDGGPEDGHLYLHLQRARA